MITAMMLTFDHGHGAATIGLITNTATVSDQNIRAIQPTGTLQNRNLVLFYIKSQLGEVLTYHYQFTGQVQYETSRLARRR